MRSSTTTGLQVSVKQAKSAVIIRNLCGQIVTRLVADFPTVKESLT